MVDLRRRVYVIQGASGVILMGDVRLGPGQTLTAPQAFAALEELTRAGVVCSLRIDLLSGDLADSGNDEDRWEF